MSLKLPKVSPGSVEQFDVDYILEQGDGRWPKIKQNLTEHYRTLVVPKLGIIFALMSQFFGSIMVLSSKLLEQNTDFAVPVNPFEVILIRMILTSLVTISYCMYSRPPDFPFGPKNMRVFLFIRAFFGMFGIYSLYFSLQYISLSANTVIGFMQPVATLFLAFLVLGERYTIYEGVGGLFSVVGVLLVVQPAFLFPHAEEGDNSGIQSKDPKLRTLGIMVAFGGVICSSITTITLRHIGKRCDPLISVQFFSVISGIMSLFGLYFGPGTGFQMLTTWKQLYLFAQLGVSGFLTQFCFTLGISREKAGRLVLLSYFSMIYSIIWEVIIWGHFPRMLTWVGFGIIVTSTATIIYLKPKEIEQELEDLEARLSNDFEIDDDPDDDHRAKQNIELSDFTIDDDNDEDSSSFSAPNSVK